MTPDISLYWSGPDQVSWLWKGDSEAFEGYWDALVDQKQQRNLDAITARLYLPHHWFTSLKVSVPGNSRRVAEAVLRFAAEEQLAQDIDALHIVALARAEAGSIPVLVIERERLANVISTLAEANIQVVQAFDAGWFQVEPQVDSDLTIEYDQNTLLCRSDWVLHQVHPSGFSQWYEQWKNHRDRDEAETPLKIRLTSRDTDVVSRQLKTELETHGDQLDWTVTEGRGIVHWNETCQSSRTFGNLMTGPFSIRKERSYLSLWLPTAVAASLALVFWTSVTLTEAIRLERQAESTWQASEHVFRQIFGQDKRIQRPLMVREVDNALVLANQGDSNARVSVLNALMALSESNQPGLILEDFRYQLNRQEMLFTLRQNGSDESSDAFASFEQTKEQLQAHGYDVEYSASAERDTARGRYRAIGGGDS